MPKDNVLNLDYKSIYSLAHLTYANCLDADCALKQFNSNINVAFYTDRDLYKIRDVVWDSSTE